MLNYSTFRNVCFDYSIFSNLCSETCAFTTAPSETYAFTTASQASSSQAPSSPPWAPSAHGVTSVSPVPTRRDPFSVDYGLWPFRDNDYNIACTVTNLALTPTYPYGPHSSLSPPPGLHSIECLLPTQPGVLNTRPGWFQV